MAQWQYVDTIRLLDFDIEPLLQSQYTWASLLLLLVILNFSFPRSQSGNENIEAPIIGSAQSWIARWRFFSDAGKVVNEGYGKVEQPLKNLMACVNSLSVQG